MAPKDTMSPVLPEKSLGAATATAAVTIAKAQPCHETGAQPHPRNPRGPNHGLWPTRGFSRMPKHYVGI